MSIMSTLRAYAEDANGTIDDGELPDYKAVRRWALTMSEAADMIDADTNTIDELRQVNEKQALELHRLRRMMDKSCGCVGGAHPIPHGDAP